MAPRTAVEINTAAVVRLTKEEASYRKERVQEERRLAALVEQGADEYELKQQRKAVEETAAMIPAVRKKLAETIEVLQNALEGSAETESAESKEKAEKAIAAGKAELEG